MRRGWTTPLWSTGIVNLSDERREDTRISSFQWESRKRRLQGSGHGSVAAQYRVSQASAEEGTVTFQRQAKTEEGTVTFQGVCRLPVLLDSGRILGAGALRDGESEGESFPNRGPNVRRGGLLADHGPSQRSGQATASLPRRRRRPAKNGAPASIPRAVASRRKRATTSCAAGPTANPNMEIRSESVPMTARPIRQE